MVRKPTVAVYLIGFSRIPALERLLDNLKPVKQKHPQVYIYLSLDHGPISNDASKVTLLESKVDQIVLRPNRLGLAEHVKAVVRDAVMLSYDYSVILEDDLIVHPSFIDYIYRVHKEKLPSEILYQSLYTPRFDETTDFPINYIVTEQHVFLAKVPASSGWFADMRQLTTVLKILSEPLNTAFLPPGNCKDWPDSSWKKLIWARIIQDSLYILYPQYCLSTNISDSGGAHVQQGSGKFIGHFFAYNTSFSDFVMKFESIARYDEHFRFIGEQLPKENNLNGDCSLELATLTGRFSDFRKENIFICNNRYISFKGLLLLVTARFCEYLKKRVRF